MCATISAGSTSSAITTNFASPLSINLVTSLVPFATLPVDCAVSNASSACLALLFHLAMPSIGRYYNSFES